MIAKGCSLFMTYPFAEVNKNFSQCLFRWLHHLCEVGKKDDIIPMVELKF